MAAKYSAMFKRVPVEETPFQYVARMQSGIMEPPTKLIPNEEAMTGPASLFLQPDQIDWTEKIRRDEVFHTVIDRTGWKWGQDR